MSVLESRNDDYDRAMIKFITRVVSVVVVGLTAFGSGHNGRQVVNRCEPIEEYLMQPWEDLEDE